MVSLDLRHNNLTGKIPQVGSLLNQGPTAFSGNPSLCGFPLQTPCPDPEAQNPRILSNPDNPTNPNSQIGFVGRRGGEMEMDGRGGQNGEGEVGGGGGWGGRGGAKGSGIVYKVVVGGRGLGVAGAVVAVRRLSEGDATWRLKEFEAEVEAVGRIQHPNIVRLRAYYYASDEKLLVSDFIRNGSLYTALHGGPAESAPPLSWSSRLRIAQGIARGLAHIHEFIPRKHIHGNIKSSKILLDDDLNPYISGFGLTRLISGTSKSTNAALKTHNLNIVNPKTSSSSSSIMYVAPEVRVSGSRFTQKSDVYSFGIVLLEILTGRVPGGGPENDGKGLENLVRKVFREERPLSEIIDPALVHEVHAKKQVVAAFHTALNCTELDPEVRPRMKTISENLDHIESQ
ncbi:leucine-rich repeat protein kinase family protein [Actinidia rufa]|uniref:Leucine-rich repeat protein kinase family protein n=1 Tax=Actinidia rufa TaxID=165716 RepID=A0A7J0F4M2_9ERIC|nr:leucine-rich repeat protein kinase family protein [Actinidia rufa]